MEQQIAADAPLDCIEFRVSPENNYYVFVCCGEVEEKVECVTADLISAHLPSRPVSEGLCDDIKFQLPEHLDDYTWFTKATIRRFLKTIDSPEPLRKIMALSNEMSQLEETRKFQISLYTQAEKRTASSDDSKNELLRAMDLRLTALGKELIATFNQAVGGACSLDDMKALEKFCDFVGNIDLRNSLSKLLESNQNSKVDNYFDHKKPPETQSDPVYSAALNAQNSQTSNLDQLVKYGASPAKVAQVERQSVSESENSSNSSEEEDQTSTERSRSRMRSATPRRSASPMRRIQFGRSGSRRTPAIGIRSLTYFPGRERAFTLRDSAQDNDGEGGGTEHGIKIPESNVRRMSVQDAINLFERKQKDQSTDAQQRKSQVDNPVKPVLRRWSSAMSESSAQKFDHCISENKVADSQWLVDEGVSNVAREIHPETAAANLSESARDMETAELERGDDVGSLSPNHTDITVVLEEELSKKVDSAEWNRQKEEELNRMLKSFALSKPKSKHQKIGSQDIKKKDSQTGIKGGIQDPPKNRRNVEMATVKQVTKKTEKQGPSRTMRKSFDKMTKVELSSADGRHVGKKEAAVSTQKEKVVKRSPLSANTKRELPKPIVNNASAKSSSLPATRKSWPLTPASRSTRTTAAKPPPDMTTSSSALSRQKTQLSAPLLRSTSKLETFQSERKEVSKIKVESKRSSQSVDENKLQVAPKSARTGKANVASASEQKTSTVPVKAGARSKITKKSTVVPLESKPSNKARKAPTAGPVRSPVPKKRGGSSGKEPLIKCETPVKWPLNKSESPICDQDNEVVILRSSETTNQNVEEQPKTEKVCHVDLETEVQVEYLPPCDDQEGIPCENPAKCNEKIEKTRVSSPAAIQHEEESSISPTAWVDDAQQDLPIPSSMSAPELVSSTNGIEVASSGSRVRHSLSQMLLEDSSDPDIVEWGNAENPPSLIFQRDAPKGLKRLLKFARKNKGDANMAGYASSPYTSEGEDDGDESKGFGRRNSDNLLKKAALNASNYGHHGISSEGVADSEPLSARSNASNSSFQSTSSATSKASRSFFSLSAFRGNKATDTKMR